MHNISPMDPYGKEIYNDSLKKAHPVVLWGSPASTFKGLEQPWNIVALSFNEEKSTEWQWALKHFSSFVPWQGANPVWEEVCDLSE